MKKSNTKAKSWFGGSAIELVLAYAATVFVSVGFLGISPATALAVTPLILVVLLIGVMVFVQLLWMLVVGFESLCGACGIRKTPLN